MCHPRAGLQSDPRANANTRNTGLTISRVSLITFLYGENAWSTDDIVLYKPRIEILGVKCLLIPRFCVEAVEIVLKQGKEVLQI